MKLDYATLISPHPLKIPNIGHIKSIKLKEIFCSDTMDYSLYNFYLSFLMLTPETYFEQINVSKREWYENLTDDQKEELLLFDIICTDINLQKTYSEVYNFFIIENIKWDEEVKGFWTYTDLDSEGKIIPTGLIHKNVFQELCEIILQRCAISQRDIEDDCTNIRSQKVRNTLKIFKKNRKKKIQNRKRNKSTELPNLISALASKSNLTYSTIWDLTVYQLYDQFRREQGNVYFDIQKMSVAAYGNKEKTFKGDEWFAYLEDMN